MGPPRQSGSGQRATHGKVAPAPLNILSSDDGGLFALNQARQLTWGWHYPATGGRHEEPYFERQVKSLLASAHSGGSFALPIYNGGGIDVIRKVLEEAYEDRLPVDGLHVCFGWLKQLNDPPADVKQSVPNAFWPTGATTTDNNPVYGGPPSEGPACLRWELLGEACKMRTVVRFRVPSDLCPDPAEPWYIEMKAATAQASYADALKVSSRSEVLDLMIGPMHQQSGTVFPVNVTAGGWKHARGTVTDLTKPFLATGWPVGAADSASAAAGASLLEEECATAQFKVDHSPDGFGHYMLRGKHWQKLCDFQITGLECVMVREAAGGDEEPTLTRVWNCLKQNGTTVTVPLCMEKLKKASISDKFLSVDPELCVTSKLKTEVLDDLYAQLPTPPSRTAPLRFGTQPDGSRLYSDCVLPADGSAPVPLSEAGLYLDEPYFKKQLGLGVGDYPTLLSVPSAEGRHACFRLMTDNWETVFGSNFVPAWLSMAYGVAGFHYCHYQEALGSWPLCYAYGGPDTGKTTSSDIVKSLTGVQSALLAGSSITEPKLAQALSSRADLCLVVDDFKPKRDDDRMETASRMLAARSERSNMLTSFRPHSALLVSSNHPLDFSDPALRNKTCCLPFAEMEKPAGTPTLSWWSDLRPVLACLAPDLAGLKLDNIALDELNDYLLSVAGKTSDRSIKDKCPLIGTALCLLHAADQLWRVDSVLRFLVDEVLCGGEAAIAEKTAATPVQNFLCDLYAWLSGNFDLCKSSDLTIHVHNCLLEEWQRSVGSSLGFTEPWVCIRAGGVVDVLNKTRAPGGPYAKRAIEKALGDISRKEPGNVLSGNGRNLKARFLDCSRGQTYHQDPETHERRPVLEGDGYDTKQQGCVWIRRAYLDQLGELRNEGFEGSEAEQRSLAPTGFESFYESLKNGSWDGYTCFDHRWLYEIERAADHRLNPEHLPGSLIYTLAAHRGEERDKAIEAFETETLFTPRLERERPDDDEQSEHGTRRARVDPPTGGLRIETQGGGQGSARANASISEVFDDFFDMDEAADGMEVDIDELADLMAL